MNKLDNQINKYLSNLQFLSPWLIRFGLGIAFSIHGLSKFPLPPEALIKYFGFSPFLASLVALAELGGGLFLIIGGFIKGPVGNLITRVSALTITIIMINALALAHRDWFITTKLFTSEQIFLLIIALYFLIKGNK
ncbi:DoxX family membrane protein [Candidatus Pelagibacter sp.]|nr:DoxX family membrane protein [Candidatus Pelagibacter sp.]